jgi:Fe2+ or Zn2+ uptake regulation protein
MGTVPDNPITDPILLAFREAGHRLTNQRIALLNVLRAQKLFLDAETLHELANMDGADLSLATVYRTLSLFKEMGLVEGRIVGEDQNREEYRFRAEREFYTLVCKRCGKIVPVEPDVVDQFRRELAETLGVTVLTAHSCFIGYCAECTAAVAAETE